jgi:hypothetical protein
LNAKTVPAKMKLILKLIDKNGDGKLSYDEIFSSSMKVLTKMMPKPGPDLAGYGEFMARTVFEATATPLN